MKRIVGVCAFLWLFVPALVWAESKTFELTVAAGAHDRTNDPVSVPVTLPESLAKAESATVESADGKKLPAQLTGPGLMAVTNQRELHFLLPALKAGTTATFKATISTDPPAKSEGFSWHDTPGEFAELTFGSRPVLRYMYTTFDESSKEKRDLTYKVFHHLYDPSGERLVTNGAGAKLYPHHRGLFYGFNKITYGDGKKADTWHCTKGSHLAHAKLISAEAGPVLGRHRVGIAWYGDDGQVFAKEEREFTVYNVPGGQLLDFASRLYSAAGKVHLDGDPQHAGFQFRANPEVAEKTAKQTYYLRPDGPGKPGETRNWDAKKPEEHANLPWNAMSFVLGDQRYTVAYLDRPSNPKPARFSERDYGRFGSYFAYDLDEKDPLAVAYRVWLQKGEMKKDDVAGLSEEYVKPVTVTVK